LWLNITQALYTIETLHNTQAPHATFCSHYAQQKLHLVSRFAPPSFVAIMHQQRSKCTFSSFAHQQVL